MTVSCPQTAALEIRVVKAVLPCLLLALVLAACSASEGRQAYLNAGCPRCHGPDRTGGAQGPPLKGLKADWTREDLRLFLKDPTAYTAKDPRLKALSERYATKMPAFALDEETRRALADFLLNEE
jgi:mono/diheme cytochrome c family protein